MKNKPSSVISGFSLPLDLYEKAVARAKKEDRSFSYVVRRALARDLEQQRVTPENEKGAVTEMTAPEGSRSGKRAA